MTLKTRLILLFSLVVLFLIITPYLVFYSLGYRIDFEHRKIVITGGIYVRVLPQPAEIIVDNKTADTTGIFSNSVFVQNLLPKEHIVLIKKEGYYDYQKSLLIKEKEVTKLENVILFSKTIPFEVLEDTTQFSLLKKKPIERFVIKNTNLYYSDSEENSQITVEQKKTPILNNILAFKVSDGKIMWFGLDGFLKSSGLDGITTENLSQNALKADPKKTYRLEIFSQNILLKEGNNLLLFDQETKSFKNLHSPVRDFKFSSEGQKVVYFNDNEILIYYLSNLPTGEKNNILLKKSTEKIGELYWLNNDYIIFNEGSKIVISEIDQRGNINVVSLSDAISLENGESIDIEKPEILFDQQNKRLYILTQNQLISSDKILP